MTERVFEYHPSAVLEARAAYEWYAEKSPISADRFWNELRETRQSVTNQPQLYSGYFHGTRYAKLRHFPYGWIYFDQGQIIIGLAVAHLRRRPGYWKNRLK